MKLKKISTKSHYDITTDKDSLMLVFRLEHERQRENGDIDSDWAVMRMFRDDTPALEVIEKLRQLANQIEEAEQKEKQHG